MVDSEIAKQAAEESGWYQSEDDNSYDEEYRPKADFRGARNLTAKQLELAEEKKKAIYDDTIRQSLEVPEYDPDEIRMLDYWLESL